jgi:hypothetical protein
MRPKVTWYESITRKMARAAEHKKPPEIRERERLERLERHKDLIQELNEKYRWLK